MYRGDHEDSDSPEHTHPLVSIFPVPLDVDSLDAYRCKVDDSKLAVSLQSASDRELKLPARLL